MSRTSIRIRGIVPIAVVVCATLLAAAPTANAAEGRATHPAARTSITAMALNDIDDKPLYSLSASGGSPPLRAW